MAVNDDALFEHQIKTIKKMNNVQGKRKGMDMPQIYFECSDSDISIGQRTNRPEALNINQILNEPNDMYHRKNVMDRLNSMYQSNEKVRDTSEETKNHNA